MKSTTLLSELIRDQATIVRLMANDFYISMVFKTLNDAEIEFLVQHRFDLSDVVLELMNFKDSPKYNEIKESYLKRIEEHVESFTQFPSLDVEDLMLDTYLEIRRADLRV